MARRSTRFKRWGRWLLAIILASGLWVFYKHWRTSRESSQDEVILAAAGRYGVDAALIKAVVWRESWFDSWARGKAGEIGLMQVGDLAAQEWADAEQIPSFAHSQLFDPAKNTLAGTWYLRKALRRYVQTDNPIPYALADYNAGRANVLKWAGSAAATNSAAFIEQIGFPTTRDYVNSVLQRYEYYKSVFPPPEKQPRTPGRAAPRPVSGAIFAVGDTFHFEFSQVILTICGVKFTLYFMAMRQRPDRAMIQMEWIRRVMEHPEKEVVQSDGRIRRWARIREMDGRALRVILLPDGETVHNAFFDRTFAL